MELLIDNTQEQIKIGLKEVDEIVQNVKLILNTPKGSVPLDRDFGISWKAIDRPPKEAFAKIKAEVIKQIRKYEPRVKIKKVMVEDSEIYDGILRIKLLIEVRENEEGKKL